MAAAPAPLLENTQAVEDLTAQEKAVWDSYQRFLRSIQLEVLSYDGLTITAAILTLATFMSPQPPA
jgi:hypothetical protein